MDTPLEYCPDWNSNTRIYVRNSAIATFYAPSDLSGIGGMHRERIRAVPMWRKDNAARNDCVFLEKDPTLKGFQGLHVARVCLFFDFTIGDKYYPCALVHWFVPASNEPCPVTGMWLVEPEFFRNEPVISVIHVDSIIRQCHLIGNYGDDKIPTYPHRMNHTNALDAFKLFYVNRWADHHSHEMLTVLGNDDSEGAE
jgi:hypothetical protein